MNREKFVCKNICEWREVNRVESELYETLELRRSKELVEITFES